MVSLKAIETKTKMYKWDLIKLKALAQQTKPKTKQKDCVLGWEKIFASDTTNKSLISEIYRQLLTTQLKNGHKT